jgi:hypothetical protein
MSWIHRRLLRVLPLDIHVGVAIAALTIATSAWLPLPLRATIGLGCALLAPGQALMLVAGFRSDLTFSLDLASKAVLSFALWAALGVLYGCIGLPVRSPGLQISMGILVVALVAIAGVRNRSVPPVANRKTMGRNAVAVVAMVLAAVDIAVVGTSVATPHATKPGVALSLPAAWSPEALLRQGYVDVQIANASDDPLRGQLVLAVAGHTVGQEKIDIDTGKTVTIRCSLHGATTGSLTISLIRDGGVLAARPLTAWLAANDPPR